MLRQLTFIRCCLAVAALFALYQGSAFLGDIIAAPPEPTLYAPVRVMQTQVNLSGVWSTHDDESMIASMFAIHPSMDVEPNVDLLWFSAKGIQYCLRMCIVLATSCDAVVFRSDMGACFMKTSHNNAISDSATNTAVLTSRLLPPLKDRSVPDAVSITKQELSGLFTSSPGSTLPSADNDITQVERASVEQCLRMCVASKLCFAVVYLDRSPNAPQCWLKNAVGAVSPRTDGKYTTYIRKSIEPIPFLYAILAGPQFIDTRLTVAAQTWLRNEHFVVYIEDVHVGPVADAMAAVRNAGRTSFHYEVFGLLAPSDERVLGVNGAWKHLAIMQHLASHYPDTPWYVIADDDSFIITHNLNIMMQHYRDDSRPLYLGAVVGVGVPPGNVLFIQGGAGIVVNRAAAKAILPLLSESHPSNCFAACQQWTGDMRLGCCFAQLKIPPLGEQGFSPQTVFESVRNDYHPKTSAFPISFHSMRSAEWVTDLQSVIDATLVGMNVTYGASPRCVSWDALRKEFLALYY